MSTAFLRKFENRISVTNRDGSITKVGEPAASVGPACNSPGKSHLHPALLATGLTGHSGGSAWPVLAETTMQPTVQVMQPAQAAQLPSPQRKVRGKPTAAELEALVMQESRHFEYAAPPPARLPAAAAAAAAAASAVRPPAPPLTIHATEGDLVGGIGSSPIAGRRSPAKPFGGGGGGGCCGCVTSAASGTHPPVSRMRSPMIPRPAEAHASYIQAAQAGHVGYSYAGHAPQAECGGRVLGSVGAVQGPPRALLGQQPRAARRRRTRSRIT